MVTKIQNSFLSKLTEQAKRSERKRKNHNYHTAFEDPVNRMLNALEPGSYVQPHKHENPAKREVFIILKGKLAVVFFNDQGKIIDYIILNNKQGNYGVEIPPEIWHTLISLESGTVVYEVKDGPYRQEDDKYFASWAPKEGNAECAAYLLELQKNIGL